MTTVGIAPGRADAERAAVALAGAGVGRVVLFGSVARGDATEWSDIDLMAIYDDLDYGERWERRCELAGLAGRAAGFPVDVSVTDRAEWRMRTTRVRTSFECRAARDGVVLVDRPAAVGVDWDKEMVRPHSDYAEAVKRLEETRDALRGLLRHLRPDPDEQDAQDDNVQAWILGRLRRGCGEAHMAVELAVKALIHLESDPDQPAWGHDIGKLCARLSEPRRRVLSVLLEPLGADEITPWRTDAVYGSDIDATPEMLEDLARTACRVASYTAGRFPAHNPVAADIRGRVRDIEHYLDTGVKESGGGIS